MDMVKDLESAAREIIRLGNVVTKRPWRFIQVLDGVEARALLDSPGYVFGRIDDLENGYYIAHTANHAVDLARSWLEMRERLERLLKAATTYNEVSLRADDIKRMLGDKDE